MSELDNNSTGKTSQIRFGGVGGQGIALAGRMLGKAAALFDGKEAVCTQTYGPEARGGTSYADVHVARREVLSPAADSPHVLLAFNAPGLEKFGPSARAGGWILYDATVIAEPPAPLPDVHQVGIPFTRIATTR